MKRLYLCNYKVHMKKTYIHDINEVITQTANSFFFFFLDELTKCFVRKISHPEHCLLERWQGPPHMKK